MLAAVGQQIMILEHVHLPAYRSLGKQQLHKQLKQSTQKPSYFY